MGITIMHTTLQVHSYSRVRYACVYRDAAERIRKED